MLALISRTGQNEMPPPLQAALVSNAYVQNSANIKSDEKTTDN